MLNSEQKASFQQIQSMIHAKHFSEACQQLEDLVEAQTDKDAEWYYRVGNLFYDAHAPKQAEMAWKKSIDIQQGLPQADQGSSVSQRWLTWRTIVGSLAILSLLFITITLVFPRQMTLQEMAFMQAMQQAEQQQSWWDEFWSNGRNSPGAQGKDQRELWYVLNEQLERMFNVFSDQELSKTAEERYVELLNQLREQQIRNRLSSGQPFVQESDYYFLISQGFSGLKQYDNAIETLQEGLEKETNPQTRGLYYKELATHYYYKGYQLQPDSLAKYDLEMVRQSIEAYEKAANYITDPYLFGNLGWGYYLLGDYQKSVFYGKKALSISPHLNYARMNIGIAYIRMHDYEQAFNSYQELTRYNPTQIDYAGGVRDLEELNRDHEGAYPFVHFILGAIYFHQENYKKAQDAWQTFLKLPFPDPTWKHKTEQILRNMQNRGIGQ